MRAVQLSRFGGPEVLEVVEMAVPVPQVEQVLIHIRAAGINFFEALMRQDRYAVTPELPMVFGVEVAGIVVATGKDAKLKIGSRVAVPLFAFGRAGGGYADYITVDAETVIALPDNLSFEAAAAVMVQGLTALHALRRAPADGKTVLITAAAGGVGSLLVQLVRRSGARSVIAAASTQTKLDLARSFLGADRGVNYTDGGWSDGIGADVIYDFVGGALTEACLKALAPGGELLFGALGRAKLTTGALEAMFAQNQSLKGFALLPLLTPDNVKADLTHLFDLAATSQLKVVLGGSYPLDQASEAHRAIDARETTGNFCSSPDRA